MAVDRARRMTWHPGDIVIQNETTALPVVADAGDHADGVMIALVPREEDAKKLLIENGEPLEELHVTLAYLGTTDELSEQALDVARKATETVAGRHQSFRPTGVVAGVGTLGGEGAIVYFLNGREMDEARGMAWAELGDYGWEEFREQHQPWLAHLTAGYGNDISELEIPDLEIEFDRVRFAVGDDVVDHQLGDTVDPEGQAEGEEKMTTATTEPITLQVEPSPPDDQEPRDDEETPDTTKHVAIQGVAVVEGTPTGDGRQFAPGGLDWPDPNEVHIAFQWQKESSHGGFNDLTVNIGELTSLERSGNEIRFEGYIDTGSEDGDEYVRRLKTAGRLGVSIVADDPENSDVELVYPDGCDQIDDLTPEEIETEVPLEDLEKCFMPELVIFHGGRIRALTAVDVPAFVEAYVELVNRDDEEEEDAVVASGFEPVETHETDTSDETWEASAEEALLNSPMTVDTARNMYAWIDGEAVEDGEIAKSNCKFPHHHVNQDGTPGAANLTACSSIIGVIHGARGGSSIPTEDERGVYDHVAKHMRDGDLEPPPFSVVDAIEPLVAASHLISIPDVPPAEWFAEPSDVPPAGALTVTDEGRVYGYLAPRNVAHRAFPGQRVTVPTGNVDYDRWMSRETIVDGGRLRAGVITMDCGHAEPVAWVGADHAKDHYDNSCAVVATVRIGENRTGVWVAGALLPDVEPAQVARMLACQLSGDWRPHREKPGKRELVAALLVPVPGFPMAAPGMNLRLDAGELVASAVPVRWRTSGDVEELSEDPKTESGQSADDDDADAGRDDDLPSWEEVQARRSSDEDTGTDSETGPETASIKNQMDDLARELGLND